MNLYLLRRTNPHLGWDERLAVVVRAESSHDARRLVALNASSPNIGALISWLTAVSDDEHPVTCELLASGVPGQEGIVCVDFKAG